MSIFFYMLSIIGVFVRKSNKLLWFCVFLSCIVVYGGYNGDLDLDNYRVLFESTESPYGIYQFGFWKLGNIAYELGIPFEIFHIILTSFTLLVICIITKKYGGDIGYVLGVSGIYSFVELGWQLKTVAAMSFILLALNYYVDNIFEQKTCLKYTVYGFGIFLAMQMHFLSLFFILIVLSSCKFLKIKLFLVIGIVLMLIMPWLISVLSIFVHEINNYQKILNPLIIIVALIYQFFGMIISYNMKKRVNAKIVDFVYKANIIFLLLCPCYMFSLVSMRIYKIFFIFEIIAACVCDRYLMNNKYKFIIALYAVVGYISFYIIIPNGIDVSVFLVKELIDNNYFF